MDEKDLYVITSNPRNGKGKVVSLLEEKLREEGYTVAILQMSDPYKDIYNPLKKGSYLYSIPLEATKTKNSFNEWVPIGYDKYILEITLPYSPMGAAYLDLFQQINEVVPYDLKDFWKEHILDPANSYESLEMEFYGDLSGMWDIVHNRTVQTIISKAPEPMNGPYLDKTPSLYNIDSILKDSVLPKMQLPKSEKKVIAVGTFPAEYYDIFPNLTWFKSFYAEFTEEFVKSDYDLAIIGFSKNDSLKFSEKPENKPIICYHPSVFLDLKIQGFPVKNSPNLGNVFDMIKTGKVGRPFTGCRCAYEEFTNKYWVKKEYAGAELVWKENNIVYCNGWIIPQYLMQEELLEVN
ncbi:hypothetical protein [uncultured Methanospirillum sp.]|uniref:hypothetical protein n=1 Tax=uncultured Methanospirillum sp. TaxID=262503 RepID=UPI0029C68E6C|nr:hypothetical protein [uncultured Methanospirillum sp.]